MTTYGVTDDGFVLKRTADILVDLAAEIDTRFPGAKTDGESVIGNIIGVFGAALGQSWEAIQSANNQYDPSAARGDNLSCLVLLNGLTRKPARSTTATLTITGTPATVIPAGSLVTTADGLTTVATDSEVTVGGGGTVSAQATATETGPIAISAGSLTQITTPISGWSSVTNASAGVTGRNLETDQELRERQVMGTFSPGSSIVESIYNAINNLEDVAFVRVYVNETGATDARGITEHSVAAVVVGGNEDDIANQIFINIPAGIATFGSTDVQVVDGQGFGYQIKFSRPTEIPIYASVTVESDSTFPLDGADQIKQAIVDYAAGGADAVGCSTGDLVGLSPGASVQLSRLYTPINSIGGHHVTSLKVGLSAGTVAAQDIEIQWNEVSTWDINNISVTVV